jgi:hypothetical protein
MSTGSDPLPDFTHFSYNFVSPPGQPKGRGWGKLKECERRLALHRWAERLNDPRRPQHRVFLDDCLSASLMTYEAALQFTGDQLEDLRVIHQGGLDQWLRSLPEYDLQVRGLRTLRHFAAHVEEKPAPSAISLVSGGGLPDGMSAAMVTRRWLLPQLDQADLQKLRRPPLKPEDLLGWNMLVQSHDGTSILEHGLRQAQAILLAAEKLL